MKTVRTTEGNVALILSPDEIKQIMDLNEGDLLLLDNNKKDFFKGMRKKSIGVIKEIHELYGSDTPINRKDDILHNILKKYYVTDFASILNRLYKNGGCELIRKKNKVNHISFFILHI